MTNFDTHRDTFANLVSELTRMAAAAFGYLDPDAKEEAIQNTIALTWHAFHALIEKGRGDEDGIIKAVLWFAIKQTRAGRNVPSHGECKPKDAFDYAKRGRVKFEKIDFRHFVSDETPVPDAVSFRLDLPQFLGTLNDRQRHMAEELATGTTTTECAQKFKVTAGAVSQFRVRFKALFDAFMQA